MIFELRQKGYSPSRISEEMRKENNIQLYPGDVYSWLDSLVHHLQAIQRLAEVMDKDELKQSAHKFARQIENPNKTQKKKKS
jgi:helicase